MAEEIIVLAPGEPTISFRISTSLNNTLDAYRKHFVYADNQRGRRTDVARSILAAILDDEIMNRLVELSKDRREFFSETLRKVVVHGLDTMK